MKCEFNGNGMSVSMGDEGKGPLLPFPGHFFCLTNLFGVLAFFLSAAALSLCVVRISLSIAFFGVANLSQFPVKPLTGKADDAIFCYYFEPGELFFENAEFDSRLVKIHRFRAKGFLSDTFLLETGRVNEMIAAGRRATESRLWEIFRDADENRVREHLSLSRQETGREFRKLTPDIMLRKVNALMKKMNRQEIREIKEAARERDATLYK